MRLLAAAISALLTLPFPAAAEEAAKEIDIMNPYKEQQRGVVERSIETDKAYKARWYDHVEERYGGRIDEPAKETEESGDTEGAQANIDEDEMIQAASNLFRKYHNYELTYDPAIVDLYSQKADIQVTKVHQSGKKQVERLSTKGYMKLRRDTDTPRNGKFVTTYSDVAYKVEDDGVRITGQAEYSKARYNRPFKGPWTILVKPDGDGNWLIAEEHFDIPYTPN